MSSLRSFGLLGSLLGVAGLLLVACDDGGGTAPGAPVDAGLLVDAGRAPDVGVAVDAASPDARVIPDAGEPAEVGVAPADAASGDAAIPDAAPEPYPSRPRPVEAATLRAPREWRFARTIMHLHSIHSHDACDGEPKPDGAPDLVCLARLRAALCHNRVDVALLTDHPGTFVDIDAADAVLAQPGDGVILGEDGEPMANLIPCPDGGAVLLSPGSEGDLMPMMFTRKPHINAHLRDRSPEGVRRLREEYGALVYQSHTEMYTAEALAALELDGFEIYNLHANLDPRGQLPEVLPDIVQWLRTEAPAPHPDLTWLAVFRPTGRALDNWDALLPTQTPLGFAGSDIHENLPPIVRPPDGDRIDSYRRLSAWFANYLLVREVTLAAVRDALTHRRLFVCFDVLGAPDGFDFHATDAAGQVVEMGTERPFSAGVTLLVDPPAPPAGATTELRVVRVDAEGHHELFRRDATDGAVVSVPADLPGAYRVELWITPTHLRAELLGLAEQFIRPQAWIYSNPIYLRD